MPKKKPNGYITAGVNFDPDVLRYLDKLSAEEDRPRSYIVNKIIRDYAKRSNEGVLPGLLNNENPAM